MKAKIHPKLNNVIFLDSTNGKEYFSTSTLSSEEKRNVNGIEYFVVKVDTSSSSHPFYTGARKNDNRSNAVAKFLAKVKKAQDNTEEQSQADNKKAKK